MGTETTSGENLRSRRENAGLTQEAFAYRAGVTVKTLYGYETGKRVEGSKYLQIQRALLQVRIEQLAPAAEQLTALMDVSPQLGQRIIDNQPISAATIESAHAALDVIEQGIATAGGGEEDVTSG